MKVKLIQSDFIVEITPADYKDGSALKIRSILNTLPREFISRDVWRVKDVSNLKLFDKFLYGPFSAEEVRIGVKEFNAFLDELGDRNWRG